MSDLYQEVLRTVLPEATARPVTPYATSTASTANYTARYVILGTSSWTYSTAAY